MSQVGDYNIANAFICGCISAGTSYLISMLVDDNGLRVPQKEVRCNCSQRSRL